MNPDKFIKDLAEALAEKRSDISDILFTYLDGGIPDLKDIESRFIQAKIPGPEGIEVEYDTLTTHLSYHRPTAQWKTCGNEEYSDG